MASRSLVRIVRDIRGADKLVGFVLAVSEQLLLLHLASDKVFLNGYSAVRIKDIKSVRVLGPDEFFSRAFAHYGYLPVEPGGVRLQSMTALLRSAGSRFPLVTIHVERDDPGVCFIGQVLHVGGGWLQLGFITPQAEWEEGVRSFPLGDVTRVDFDRQYERALHALAREASDLTPGDVFGDGVMRSAPLGGLLMEAKRAKSLVRVERGIPRTMSLHGFVLTISDQIVLLHYADSDIYLDGYVAIRPNDITGVTALGPDDFFSRAFAYYRYLPVEPDGLDARSMSSLLRTGGPRFPLTTIYREWVNPNVCGIGRFVSVGGGWLRMHSITPQAKWESEEESARLSEITRIEFGGRYEQALAAVAR
jgi:hypothetical protein